MKDIPLDILSTTQKSWRRLGSEAVACKHVKDEGCHKEEGAKGHFGGVALYSTQTKGNERSCWGALVTRKVSVIWLIALLLERIGDWYL